MFFSDSVEAERKEESMIYNVDHRDRDEREYCEKENC